MNHELDGQPQTDHQAGQVRGKPARVLHDLQHGHGVAWLEAGLIERHAVVAQRVVHENFHLTVLVFGRVHHAHATAEVLGQVRAGVALVGEVHQREAVGLIVALEAESHFPRLAIVLDDLLRTGLAGDEPCAFHRATSRDLDDRAGNVPAVHRRHHGHGQHHDLGTDALIGGGADEAFLGERFRDEGAEVGEEGVGPILFDLHREGQLRVFELTLSLHERLRDGDHFILVGQGFVDEDQLVGVEVLGVILRLALFQPHRALGGKDVRAELAQQQQDDAEVGHENAGLAPGPLEAGEVGHREVHEQDRTQRVAAGQDEPRHLGAKKRDADDDPAFEVADLGVVKTLMDLRQRADEDQHQAEHQQDDGKPEGGEGF